MGPVESLLVVCQVALIMETGGLLVRWSVDCRKYSGTSITDTLGPATVFVHNNYGGVLREFIKGGSTERRKTRSA